MSRYLDPTNDIAFRKLFGTENHKPLLVSFLNSILSLEGERRIKQVELLPRDQVPLIKDTKLSILDVKCTDERNVQYIVEMQNKNVPAFIKRTQFYVAHSYVTQFPAGSEYFKLKPVILLAIANHKLFPSKKSVISYHKTLDIDTLEHDLEDMSYIFIEIPKFTKREEDLETTQDKWLYFFKNWGASNEVPSAIQEKELLEAYRSMEEYNWNKAEREAYIKANIAMADEYDARRKEREEGREEKKLQIAFKLLKRGRPLDEIVEDTGLSAEEVKSLQSSRFEIFSKKGDDGHDRKGVDTEIFEIGELGDCSFKGPLANKGANTELVENKDKK